MTYELSYEFTIEEDSIGHGDYHGRFLIATFSTKEKAEDYLKKYQAKLVDKYGERGTFKIDSVGSVPHDPE